MGLIFLRGGKRYKFDRPLGACTENVSNCPTRPYNADFFLPWCGKCVVQEAFLGCPICTKTSSLYKDRAISAMLVGCLHPLHTRKSASPALPRGASKTASIDDNGVSQVIARVSQCENRPAFFTCQRKVKKSGWMAPDRNFSAPLQAKVPIRAGIGAAIGASGRR